MFESLSLTRIIIVGILIFICGLITLIISSMGIECYNKNGNFKKSKGGNFSFMVITLIIGILTILASIGLIAFRVYVKTQTRL